MSTGSKIILTAVVVAAIVALATWLIDVDVSGDLEVPEVSADVDVSGGEMPAVDVNTADIEVQERQAEIEVPSDVNVDVETEEETVNYPTVDVTEPEENDVAEEDDL